MDVNYYDSQEGWITKIHEMGGLLTVDSKEGWITKIRRRRDT